jgi:hypothetical protein
MAMIVLTETQQWVLLSICIGSAVVAIATAVLAWRKLPVEDELADSERQSR